jgi:hypothetical protein
MYRQKLRNLAERQDLALHGLVFIQVPERHGQASAENGHCGHQEVKADIEKLK